MSKISKKKTLTILSYGAGQDSTAILLKLIRDSKFRAKYAPGDLLVLMADTGNEHRETIRHVKDTVRMCKKYGIRFYFIALRDGFTSPAWDKGLVGFYESGNRIGSKAFPKSCTDTLKIQPIYKFLDWYIHKTYHTTRVGRKGAIKEFVGSGNKIDVLLGISKGEERRASTNADSPHMWQRECINKVYPLLDLQMGRAACQAYIAETHKVPPPSNCILCPFINEIELLHMYRFNRWWYTKWVALEQNKINANLDKGERNLGVWGQKLLPEKLTEVINKYGYMSNKDLIEYKMSHGHCVQSKY